jgi:NTE family protein
MTTAFVSSGGGSLGAVQVGMLQALTARGVEPDWLGAAGLGWAPSLWHNGSIRRLVREHLAFDRLEDAPIPLHVVATDVGGGQDVRLSTAMPSTPCRTAIRAPTLQENCHDN